MPMSIMCKLPDAQCPRDLRICCHTCKYMPTCDMACSFTDRVLDACEYSDVETEDLVSFQNAAPEVIQRITDLVVLKKQLEEQEKKLKVALVEAMETYNVKSFENDDIKLTYVAPTTRTTVDTARFKKDYPGIAERYVKTSMVGSSVRITVKGDK